MDNIPEEYERGKQECERDIANGSAKLFWGTRGSWGELLTRLMAERFSVVVEHISDMTNSQEMSYRSGYNSVTRDYIEKSFGVQSFQGVLNEVEQHRRLIYQRYLESQKTGPELGE